MHFLKRYISITYSLLESSVLLQSVPVIVFANWAFSGMSFHLTIQKVDFYRV